MNFYPVTGCVLVKLDSSPYEHISTESDKYDSANSGTVMDYGDYPDLEDKRVIWEQYKEKEATFTHEGESYAIIEHDKIRGVSE